MVYTPRYQEVDYNDEQHKYFLGEYTYISATQLIDRFKPKFDVDERSDWMVYRYGNTKQYWIDKWKKDNTDSLIIGNKVHNYQERKLINKGYDLLPYPVPVQSYSRGQKLSDLPDGVYPELKLWRHDCKIAGRADKIILSTQTGAGPNGYTYKFERTMDIDDYKTNKRIRTESYQNPRTKEYTMMLGPVSHLMDCEIVHYTLQFSIYQYMGEYHGFLPGRRRIIHYPHPIEGIKPSGNPVIKELPYLRNEVVSMIKYYRDANN